MNSRDSHVAAKLREGSAAIDRPAATAPIMSGTVGVKFSACVEQGACKRVSRYLRGQQLGSRNSSGTEGTSRAQSAADAEEGEGPEKLARFACN